MIDEGKRLGSMLAISGEASKILEESLKNLSATQILTKTSTMGLTEVQKIELIQLYATDKANYSNITSTTALSASQKSATIATTGFSTALKGLWATMMANPLIAVGMAVTAISTAWNMYNQHVQEAIQTSNKATDEFNSTSSAIKDYADRYKELRAELLDANTSEERQHEIKSDLLSLQKELNDSYGDEHGRLNLVTDAYRDQTKAILDMNKAAAQNYLLDNKKGIETATKEMAKERTYELGSTGVLNDDYSKELYNIASLYKDQGVNLTQIDGTDLPAYTITFKGNADEAEKVIRELSNKIQDLDKEFKDHDAVGSVLSYTTSALKSNKSILDDYQADYNASLMANIASDDELSKGYDKAFEAVTRYNEAVISGDETKILDARNNLNEVKDSIDLSSDEWIRYGSIMSNIFKEANTGIYDFRDALSVNTHGIANVVSGLQNKTKEELLAMADDGEFDSFDKLIAFADDYGVSIEQVIDELIRMGIVQEDIAKTDVFAPLSKADVIANINSLSEGFETLDKIMKSISDKDNPFDYALLDDTKFKDNFDKLGETYTNFIETVSNSPKDINATQSAFNDLITEWIDSKDVLNGVTAETSDLSVAMLKNMGVANAEEVVLSQLTSNQEHLAAQKAYTAEMSDALANATANEIPGLIDEATQSDIAKVALAGLALEKAHANGTILNTSGDIENAIALINTIGAATTALVAYNKAKAGDIFDSSTQKANLNNLMSAKTGLGLSVEIDKQLNAYQDKMDSLKADVDKEVQDAIKKSSEYKGQGANVNTIYNGGPKTNKDGGSDKKSKEEAEKTFDWYERRLKLYNDKRDELMEKASDTTIDYLGITNEEFARAKELFDGNTDSISGGANELADIAKRAGMSLSELYTLIANGNPGESRENYLAQILELDKTIIPETEQAVEHYKKLWEDAASKISVENRTKIEFGYNDVETFPDAEGKEIQTAIDAYDKWISLQKQYEEIQDKNTATSMEDYDNRSAAINKENEQLEKTNSLLEARIAYLKSIGEIPSASIYEKLIDNTGTEISNTQKDISELKEKLKEARKKYGSNSEEYADIKGAISDAEISLYSLKKAQEEYNQALKQMPIDNMATIVSMYNDISDAMQNYASEVESDGKKLNAEYYQAQISNGAKVIDQLKEQAGLIEDVMSEYEVGSDNWQDLYGQLRSVNSEMSTMVVNMRKFNEELLKMPLENIGTYSDSLQKVVDGLTGVQSEQDTVISAVTGAIQEQIDAINKLKDTENEERQLAIDALQEKLDLLDRENELRKLQYDLEQKQYNLERIRSQKSVATVRDGEIVYESDKTAERQAEQDYLDAQDNMAKHKLQEQIDNMQEALENLNKGYDDQISKLEEISSKWSEISQKIKQSQDESVADRNLGTGWKDKVLSGNDSALFNTFSGMYKNTADQLQKYQEQINSTKNIQSLLEDYIASYKSGEITYAEAVGGINDLLSQMNQRMPATDNLQNIFDYLGTVNDTAANADAILTGIQEGLKDTATELLESLEQYNKNSGMISEYTSSWQQLTNNVASMLDVLKEVRDALEDSNDRDDDEDNDNTRYGGGKDGSPGIPGRGEYVNSGPGVSRKDGIKRGLVGVKSESDREASMKLLGLKKLDPDELPAVLHMGEAVFNEDQQKNLLENMRTAWNFKPSVPDYSKALANIKTPDNSSATEITFNGGITIQKCDNPDEFAQGIMRGDFASALRQRMARR